MEIKKNITLNISKSEIEEILKDYFSKEYDVKSIAFNIEEVCTGIGMMESYSKQFTGANIYVTDKKQNEKVKEAYWKIWSGWRSNYDKRIESAKCSNCGYEHVTVYEDVNNLSKICYHCGSEMSVKETY